MTHDAFTIDEETDDGPGAYLRISRPATPEDLVDLLPDKTEAERAAWLAKTRGDDYATVTMAVVVELPQDVVHAYGETVPVREITGLIIGPPGSERYLRRAGDEPALDALRHGITVQETRTLTRPASDRDHAGLGLPCNVCGDRCTIDDEPRSAS